MNLAEIDLNQILNCIFKGVGQRLRHSNEDENGDRGLATAKAVALHYLIFKGGNNVQAMV